MPRLLVCWEDDYYEPLALALRRALRHLELPRDGLEIEGLSVRGAGNFDRFVREDWPRARKHGLSVRRGARPLDFALCVADADSAQRVCRGVPPPPADSTDVWIKQADEQWTASLRDRVQTDRERINGSFLRWSRESLTIAALDCDAVAERLGLGRGTSLKQHVSRSKGRDPFAASGAEFTETYRKPLRCLDELQQQDLLPRISKNNRMWLDAVNAASANAIGSLCDRVPDLVKIARLASNLGAA